MQEIVERIASCAYLSCKKASGHALSRALTCTSPSLAAASSGWCALWQHCDRRPRLHVPATAASLSGALGVNITLIAWTLVLEIEATPPPLQSLRRRGTRSPPSCRSLLQSRVHRHQTRLSPQYCIRTQSLRQRRTPSSHQSQRQSQSHCLPQRRRQRRTLASRQRQRQSQSRCLPRRRRRQNHCLP